MDYFGTTYYVKFGGSDNANGTSVATAWATITKAMDTVTDGDIVWLAGTTEFTESITITKAIFLGCMGDLVAIANTTSPIVDVQAHGVTLKGLHLRSDSSSGSSRTLRITENSSVNTKLYDLSIYGGTVSLEIGNCNKVYAENIYVEGRNNAVSIYDSTGIVFNNLHALHAGSHNSGASVDGECVTVSDSSAFFERSNILAHRSSGDTGVTRALSLSGSVVDYRGRVRAQNLNASNAAEVSAVYLADSVDNTTEFQMAAYSSTRNDGSAIPYDIKNTGAYPWNDRGSLYSRILGRARGTIGGIRNDTQRGNMGVS